MANKTVRPSIADQPGPLDFDDDDSDASEWWSAERIVASRTTTRGRGRKRRTVIQYRIRYAGYGPNDDSWEDADGVGRPLVREWKKSQGLEVTNGDWAEEEDKEADL